MGRLYDLVTRHFLASLSHDARFLQTKVLFSSECGESFSASGKIMIDPGYLAVLAQSKVRKGWGAGSGLVKGAITRSGRDL